MSLVLYDTTLRDGVQREGMSLSLEDKLKIARAVAALGIAYIEGGWPGSNPKDAEFFRRVREVDLGGARVAAFGSTRRAGLRCEDDPNIRALVEAGTPVVTLVGKSSTLHVERVLETTRAENLRMIADSVGYLKALGKEVVFDAEHFFDGYARDPGYALDTLAAAAGAGADWVVLCDTNGGTLPEGIRAAVEAARARIAAPLGIHPHNDAGLAVANALAAVQAGCTQVQGTINGYGERCGNVDLIPVAANLQLKLGYPVLPPERLRRLREVSQFVAAVANLNPDSHAPYVGRSAFAHKGGIHVAAVAKLPQSYQHVDPALVGNEMRVVVSEVAGRRNVRLRADALGLDAPVDEEAVLRRIKEAPPAALGPEEDEARAACVLALVEAIRACEGRARELEAEIVERLEVHPDAHVFTSLPRAGRGVRAASLLAEIGDARQRFPDPESLMALAGAAPVTRASGKHRVVSFRWACDKKLRAAVVDFADDSRRDSAWARGIYERAIAKGYTHPHAVRILARAWLRVIWRCWQDGVAYDVTKHRGAVVPIAA